MKENLLKDIWNNYPKLIGDLPKDFYNSTWGNDEFPSYAHDTNNFIIWVENYDTDIYYKTDKYVESLQFGVIYGYNEDIETGIYGNFNPSEYDGIVKTWEEVLEHHDKWIKEYNKRFPNWKKEIRDYGRFVL